MCGHVAPSLPGIDPPGRAGSLVSFQGKAFAHFFNETVWLCFPGHTGAYNTKAPGESACLAATHSEGSGCVSRNPFFFLFQVFVVRLMWPLCFPTFTPLEERCCLNVGIFRTLMN